MLTKQKNIKKINENKNVNIKELNILNVIFCFSVIMIHITSRPISVMNKESFAYLLIFILNKILCFVVPGFIFLSGFKLFNKYKNEDINIKKFYKSRFKKIVVPYLISLIIYFLYYLYKGYVDISVTTILKAIFLGDLVAHFYYIIIAIQLYLAFPFLNYIIKKYPQILLIASFILNIIFKEFIRFNYSDRFILGYIFYFVLGMIISKNLDKIKLKNNFKNEIICLICFVLSKLYLLINNGVNYEFAEIINIFYVALAIFVMYIIANKISKFNFIQSFCDIISKNSFNIFLYHILLLQILQWEIFSLTTKITLKYEFLLTCIIIYSVVIGACYLKSLYNKKRD